MKTSHALLFLGTMLSTVAANPSAQIEKVMSAPALHPLPLVSGGRMTSHHAQKDKTEYTYQWPGTYFESAFEGTAVYVHIGAGDQNLHFTVDNQSPLELVKPLPGTYRIGGLAKGRHTLRLEVVNESQDAPNTFGGFALAKEGTPLPIDKRARQIEFIGDSHTVGYGNTSPIRECTPAIIWKTTDNSQAFGPLTAKHYHADYQTNAISGRGIVRNYSGFAADPIPVVYPFVLFDKKIPAEDPTWQPQIIVINLGTNDFSTPLHPEEKWKTRDELHQDYEATYVRFVQSLRAKNPKAFFILLANDTAEGEIQIEVQKVFGQLKSAGENHIAYIPIATMELTACDWHPSLKDHQAMSHELIAFIDAHPELWQGK